MARRLGATEAQLAAVERGSYDDFEQAWRSALKVADAMTPTRGGVEKDDYAALAAHWTTPQIVEIISVIGLFNYFNRFAETLHIPPTV